MELSCIGEGRLSLVNNYKSLEIKDTQSYKNNIIILEKNRINVY